MSTHSVGQRDLKSLQSELHPVTDKWYSLGVQLQVSVETLKCIEVEHHQMNRCLLEMLTVWLKCTNPSPIWNILTEALESPPVGERLLAQQLRENYCPTTPPDAPLTPQPPTPQPPTATPPPEHTGRWPHNDSNLKVLQYKEHSVSPLMACIHLRGILLQCYAC